MQKQQNRSRRIAHPIGVVLAALILLTTPIMALDTSEQAHMRTTNKIEFGSGLKFVNMFRGKAGSKEGLVTETVIKGPVQVTITGKRRQAIDLARDMMFNYGGRRCKAQSLDEMREQFKKMQEQLQDMPWNQQNAGADGASDSGDTVEYELDFNVTDTGEQRSIGGYSGKVLEIRFDAYEKAALPRTPVASMTGTIVMAEHTAETRKAMQAMQAWTEAYLEVMEFSNPQDQLAQVFAQAPILKKMQEELTAEFASMDGWPLQNESTFLLAAPAAGSEEAADEPQRGGGFGGGLLGGLRDRTIGAAVNRNKRKRQEAAEANNGGMRLMYSSSATTTLLTAEAGDLADIPAKCTR